MSDYQYDNKAEEFLSVASGARIFGGVALTAVGILFPAVLPYGIISIVSGAVIGKAAQLTRSDFGERPNDWPIM